MKRRIDLALVPANGYHGDEHPFCPFVDCNRTVMVLDDCGDLVCPDCRTSALAVEEHVQAERVASWA
ncbi:MAG: hypothetical protein ABW022_03240 [Actinoplanes sp.]